LGREHTSPVEPHKGRAHQRARKVPHRPHLRDGEPPQPRRSDALGAHARDRPAQVL